MPPTILDLFIAAFGQSLLMVGAAGLLAALLGLPLGLLLHAGDRALSNTLSSGRMFAVVCAALRSGPVVMALAIAAPLAQHALSGEAGLGAAIASLTVIATPFLALRVRNALNAADRRDMETARRRGAAKQRLLLPAPLPQAFPSIVRALGLMLAALVGYSSIAGALLGLGLGDLALRQGYQQFQPMVMLSAAIASVALAETAQAMGNLLAARLQSGPGIAHRPAAHRLPPR